MPSLAERFAALPEWAQVWLVCKPQGSTGIYCYPTEGSEENYGGEFGKVWYCADDSTPSVFIHRDDVNSLSRLEAAEAMAAHRERMEAGREALD